MLLFLIESKLSITVMFNKQPIIIRNRLYRSVAVESNFI